MGKFNALLNLRLKQKDSQKPKMNALAERTNNGNLSSFSGVFRVTALNETEKNTLEDILNNFREDDSYSVSEDLDSLIAITSEVRAITNQAVILHGERIKKAQQILKSYRDGAFTAWLVATYGNRQTPYNFLQYYDFYMQMPSSLHLKIDSMPRQAIYTLASRSGDLEAKREIIDNYQGQSKQELLSVIRKVFPLSEIDKRAADPSDQLLQLLKRCVSLARQKAFDPTEEKYREIHRLLRNLQKEIDS